MSELLTVENLTIKSANQTLVDNLSYTLNSGETLAIVGESGSGKSISSLALLGLLPNSLSITGKATLTNLTQNPLNLPIETNPSTQDKHQENLFRQIRGKRIGIIFQEPMTALNPLHTIGNQLTESLKLAGLLKGARAKADWHAKTLDLLTQVNIPDPSQKLNRYPHELSGGQRQRIMIAMALAQDPDILIADEPTTALDVTLRHEILGLLDRLKAERGMALILISHDLQLVKKYSDNLIVMQAGKVVEQGSREAIFTYARHPYTQSLLNQDFGKPLPLDENASNILSVKDLSIEFIAKKSLFGTPLDWFKAVDNLSFDLAKGQSLGIVGESGSGKTTTALALLKLLGNKVKVTGEMLLDTNIPYPCGIYSSPPKGEEIPFLEEEARGGQKNERKININSLSNTTFKPYRNNIQMVFQDPYASINPRFTVMQIIEEGLTVQNVAKDQRENLVLQALDTVCLPREFASRYPHELSGGQRQRVALARSLVMRPQVLILDEPTSALDSSTQVAVVELLRDIQAEFGLSYIFISHDLNVVRALCQRILVLKDGKVQTLQDTEDLFNHLQGGYVAKLIKNSN